MDDETKLVVATPVEQQEFFGMLDDLVEAWELEGDESLKTPAEWLEELTDRFHS